MKIKGWLIGFIMLTAMSGLMAQEKPDYSVYLIGDSGAPSIDKPDEVFTSLKKRLDLEKKNAAIVFLGDNIYHNGLPPETIVEEAENRRLAEKKLLVQLEAIDQFKGKIFFIPGNHDWNDAKPDGIDYIKAQEEYVEFFLDRGDVLIPDHGCPGPEKKKLGKNIVLLAMDSQWWLHPHKEEQIKNSTCKNKNIDDIIQELKEHLDENDDKQIIIALHHPIYSDGSHNGYFPPKKHLFPLTALNKNLWIPLPGLGSLYPFFRTTFGARQDMAHPTYQLLREKILDALEGRKNVVLASGHEHNLQYFFEKENHFIKSGSGSKSSSLPKKTNAIFSNDSEGFAKLEYFKSGEVKLKYYTIEDGEEIERFNQIIMNSPEEFGKIGESYELNSDPIESSASTQYEKNGLHRSIFGDLHRQDWAAPVLFRSIDLSVEKGGLKPTKIGGGMSSLSIRLKDKDKKEYVLRSVEKGVSKVVPQELRYSVIEDVFQDQISASQPYAALLIPPLAKAIGVYHTNPEILFLPKQPALGDFNTLYGDHLYLFEERPSGNQEEVEEFGNSRKIVSYSKMLEKIRTVHGHHIHQDQVLKSRLFDIYLGDWDRHDDQWRWASFKEKHDKNKDEIHTYYEPIPRDRDQALFRYEGVMPWVAKLLSPELRKFQTFGSDIKNLKYLAYNARHFDRTYLNQLDYEDWDRISTEIVDGLSDESITEALDQLPIPIQKLRRSEYETALKQRKLKLKKWSMDHYEFISKYVDVVGTIHDEIFEVEYSDDGSVGIKVYHVEDDGHEDLFYNRMFFPSETKEIRLYGLDGKDQFLLKNEIQVNRKGPKVRIIGGKGDDFIKVSDAQKKVKPKVNVYDNINDSGMDPSGFGRDKRSSDLNVNEYNRKEFYYNSSVGFPIVGFNPDDGLILKYSQSFSSYGFRKTPYKSNHTIGFRYASNTNMLSLDYTGHFVDVLGKTDLELEMFLNLPNNVQNFFGLSNSNDFSVSDFDDFDFYRYSQTDIHIHPSLLWSTKRGVSQLSLGPFFRHIEVLSNEGKFISDFEHSGLSGDDFKRRNYIGVEAEYKLKKVDSPSYPTTGIDFKLVPAYYHNLNSDIEKFTSLRASLTLYNFLWIPKPFVLASRISYGVNWGEFSFNQAHFAGLSDGLRAYRNQRFGGKSSFVFSNDLRVKVGRASGALPMTFGLIGAYDVGKVWNENEVDRRWHRSYGGGFFISPFDVLPISFYYMKSSESTSNFILKLGFAL